jgi:MFS family permease
MNKKLFWIYLLSAITYFTQGIEGIPGSALFFYMKETLHFNASTIMYIGTITGLAWLVKPIWGILIENFWTKKVWIYLSLIGSILLSLFLGFSPFLAIPLLIVLLTFGSTNTAWRDVAVDSVACVEGKVTNNTGQIQAIQWGAITVASIIVGLGGGYIAEHFTYQLGFLCLVPFYLIMLWVVYHFQETQKCTSNDCRNCKHANSCPKFVFEPSIFVTNCPNHVKIIESKSFLNNIKSYKILFTNKKFLIACLFLFLYKYSPSFGTPLAFIERDTFGWSRMWMGTLGAIVSCFEIVGAILFYKYCKKLNYKKWLTWSVYIGAITTLFYLYFTPQTAILYGILFATMGMIIYLMIMSWMAQTSIDGKEATSFAVLCSISNLSGTCSSLSGAWLFPILGLQPLILLSAITSFLCLPLISKLNLEEK